MVYPDRQLNSNSADGVLRLSDPVRKMLQKRLKVSNAYTCWRFGRDRPLRRNIHDKQKHSNYVYIAVVRF